MSTPKTCSRQSSCVAFVTTKHVELRINLGDLVEALDCRLVQQKRMSRKLTAPLLCNATQTSAHQRILGLPRTSWKHSTNLEFAWPRSQWDGQTFWTVTNSNGTLWHVALRYFYHLLPLLPFFPRIPAMCCVSAGEAGGRRALQGLNIPWQWYCWCRIQLGTRCLNQRKGLENVKWYKNFSPSCQWLLGGGFNYL